MAILATAQWWVRVSGNALNGGGYDAAISGAGTNYADQDSPELSLSDFTTSGAASTTLTSATGGFTTAMIGNCVRIASGTNFQTGYYFITARADTNNVTLDRTPTSGGAGSSGTGRVGGAFASVGQLASSGTLGSPTLTTPLAAGHQVNVRGSGSDLPSSADYTHTGGFWQFPNGAWNGAGIINWVGYNGRPRFHYGGLLFHSMVDHSFENFYAQQTALDFNTLGFVNDGGFCTARNIILDQNGYDSCQLSICFAYDLWARNTGSTTAGSVGLVNAGFYNGVWESVYVENSRGNGINLSGQSTIRRAIVDTCGLYGIRVLDTGSGLTPNIDHVTIYSTGSDGIRIEDIPTCGISNSIIYSTGGYAINVTSNYSGTNNNRASRIFPTNNAFRSNTSGKYNNWSGVGDIDLSADPFVDAAGGDFRLNSVAGGGALLKATAYPLSWRGAAVAMVNYLDIGAVQHRDPARSYFQLGM